MVCRIEQKLTTKYLNGKGQRVSFMTGKDLDVLCKDKGYRIRSMRSLAEQIKEDHKGLKRIWDRLVKGPIGRDDEEEFMRLISWLREGLNVYKEFKQRGIEGILWGEIEEIDKDIQDKERRFRLNPNCVSKKTGYTHLR